MNLKELRNIVILDIETVSAEGELSAVSDRLQAQWIRKSGFIRNEQELTPEELFVEKAGIYAEFGKIVAIGLGVFHSNDEGELSLRVKALGNKDEKALLLEFKELLTGKFNSDRLKFCSHNGKEFDFPYLCRRMLINKIRIPEALNLRDRKPWEVQHYDTMDLWKFGDRKNFSSLELLTALFGIESSKYFEDEAMDGSSVNRIYYQEKDLEKIKRYCKGDVVATGQLFLCLNNLETIKENNITILD
ncbi:MAG: ribonuclease H-like domain-containing protein [Cyclobacteriaceae bacterium]